MEDGMRPRRVALLALGSMLGGGLPALSCGGADVCAPSARGDLRVVQGWLPPLTDPPRS